ncbi:hypothetical protein CPB86DRAFT_734686 [Serendipita vermifera]|nr:hypothetical protein CPB86DRAFT_734686 [Serendipita vermifera]
MPRPKNVTQATQRTNDDDEDFEGPSMDLDDDAPASGGHRQKTSRRSGAASSSSLSAEASELEKKADDLCRLALFTEYRRLVLKREDINKKVLGAHTKAFPEVLAFANKRLKNALGYEIIELVSKAEREKLLLPGDTQDDEAKKKGSSKQYILRSLLDPELIKLACTPDEDIKAQELADAANDELPVSGTILAWQISDQMASYGTLYVILSLILVNGKTIADATLRSQLKKLQLMPNSSVEVGTDTASKRLSLEQYLNLLIRQGYLDRVKIGNISGQKTGAKRPRGSAPHPDAQEGSVDFEWRWGERAHAEISEEGISDFIVEFMVERSRPTGNEPESSTERKDRLAKLQKQLVKDIKKAALTPLTIVEREQGQEAAA